MTSAKNDQIISLRLSKKLKQKLIKYSQKQEIPVSIVIRKLLSAKLKPTR